MNRHRGRWAEPLLLVTIAGAMFVDSISYPPAVVPGAPGPGFFPRLLALILVACAAWLAWLPARAPGERTSGGWTPEEWIPGATRRPESDSAGGPGRLLGAIGLIAGFLLLAPGLDTFASLPLLVGGLMAIMGERRIPALVGIPVMFTAFVYVVLFRALGVMLPTRFL